MYEKNEQDFDGGIGYCDKFKCRLHELKPDDCEDTNVEINVLLLQQW